jgi:hypothetical protein
LYLVYSIQYIAVASAVIIIITSHLISSHTLIIPKKSGTTIKEHKNTRVNDIFNTLLYYPGGLFYLEVLYLLLRKGRLRLTETD